jgi:fumarylacetoacetase
VPEPFPFPLENLLFGSMRREPGAPPRLCVALGDEAIELASLVERLDSVPRELLDAPNLDRLLRTDPGAWAEVREALAAVVSESAPASARIPLEQAIPCLPFTVGDYVDFFSSLEHATNVGRMFRSDGDALPPNWRHLPVGYHGRSSTVIVSGTPVRRPYGQLPGREGPTWGPSRRLDIELELGFVAGGPPNQLGEAIPIERAAERIFGFVLVNDWSARDVQAWESRPLGPFLAKSFATSISPWVVPRAALDPYRVAPPRQEPEPFRYLRLDEPWALDLELEAALQPAGGAAHTTAATNARELYWTAPQQLAHAASGGAIVRPGDLFAAGTISGAGPGRQGCLLELTWNGERPLHFDASTRTFLEDGDVVRMTARTGARDGRPRIGFGELRGEVLPAAEGA